MKLKKYYLLLFGIVLSFNLSSQELVNDAENIKTIVFRPQSANNYTPYVRLGEPITLSFDDLNGDESDYYYKIEHCDLNWEVSSLSETEFIRGYAEERIRDYENSFNTLQDYTHYYISFPNEDTQLLISGNYLLSVKNDFDEVVFQRRFIVYESQVTVGVAVYKSRDISYIDTKQAIEFSIDYSNFRINNPKNEVFPVILQNDNWQTTISGLKPLFYRGTQLLYKYNKETSFWAGNEFLHFDSKTIRNSNLYIANVDLGADIYHSYLYTNEERIDQPYTLFPDINGNFIVNTQDGDDPSVEADYSWVHFYLKCLENLDGKEIYIQGNFNNWQLSDLNKMEYNYDLGLYEGKMKLKQGFYNYQYITVDEKGAISNYDIDGSFFQTENNYTVIVYYKPFGSRYTRVIGIGFGNSEKLNN